MAASTAWQEQDNCFRCCKLTLDGGAYLAKQLLLQETIHNGQFNTIDAFLAANKSKLKIMKFKGTVKDSQYDILFPKAGSTDLNQWDITLVTLVLISCFKLSKTQKDAIKDMREMRNSVHGHTVQLAMTDSQFHQTWTDISTKMKYISTLLADPNCHTVITDMIASIETEVLSSDKLVEIFREWYESDKQVEKMIRSMDERQEFRFKSLQQQLITDDETRKTEYTNVQQRMSSIEDTLNTSLSTEATHQHDLKNELDVHSVGIQRIEQRIISIENQMTVPSNQTVDEMKLNRMLEHAKQRLENHSKELDKLHMGYNTRLSQMVVKQLQDTHITVITGIPGIGKTHLALNSIKLLTDTHDTVPSLRPLIFCDPTKIEVEEVFDPNNCPVLFFDDFLGRVNVDTEKVCEWNRYISTLMSYVEAKKVFVVISIRKVILNTCLSESVNAVFKDEWIIDLEEKEMSIDEKKNMITGYARYHDIELLETSINKVIHENSHCVGFPLLCKVMKGKDILTLFTRPVDVLKEDIRLIANKDPSSFVSLFMTMFGKGTVNSLEKEACCFEQLRSHFEGQTINHQSVITSTKSLLQTYLKLGEDGSSYEFVHDTILEATFLSAKDYIPVILIEFCPLDILVKYSQSFTKTNAEDKSLKCSENTSLFHKIIQRFRKLFASKESSALVQCVAGSPLWTQPSFIRIALEHISPEVFYKEDDNGSSLMVYFAGFGNVELMKQIDMNLLACPLLLTIDTKEKQYKKAMIQSCIYCNSESVSHFIVKGMTIDEEIVFAAVKGGNTSILELLLAVGGSIKAKRDETGDNLLHEACLHDNIAMTQYILLQCEQNVKLELVSAKTIKEKHTPLMNAAMSSSPKNFQLMIDSGSDITCVDADGRSCLHMAALKGNFKMEEFICKNYPDKINIQQLDYNGHTVAHAASSCDLKCLTYVIDQGINPMTQNKNGVTVLHIAAQNGRLDVVKYLCGNYKGLIQMTDNNNRTVALYASQNGNFECLVYLIEQGVDPMIRTNSELTVLHIAAQNGRLDVVKYLCGNYKGLIQMTDNNNRTVALYASQNGNFECLVYLIEQGVDSMIRTNSELTVLHIAAQNGRLDAVKYLCGNYKGLIQITDNNNRTADHFASQNGNLECLVYLIDQGVDPMIRTNSGATVLHAAARHGRLNVVKYLCDNYKGLIKMTNKENWTAALYASEYGHLECLVYLIEQGVDPMIRNNGRSTVLHVAAMHERLDVVKYLCDNYKGLIQMTNNDNWTAAHYASYNGNLECLVYLIEQGVDPMIRNNGMSTVLHVAAMHGRIDVVKYLCDNYKGLIQMTNKDNWTAALYASYNGNLECLVYLIEQGVDPMIMSNEGATVLHIAALNGLLDVVKYLCGNYKGLIQRTDNNNRTADHYASENGNLECLVYMIEQGVDPMIMNNKGATVLHIAALNGHLDVVKYMCGNYKGLIQMTDNNNWTAAHYASYNGHLECLVYLIEQGVDPMITNNGGATVLHTASNNGHFDVVKYLCGNYKRLPHMMDANGRTAADLALENGDIDCVAYLAEQGEFPMARNARRYTCT